jgi:hypothetical protein
MVYTMPNGEKLGTPLEIEGVPLPPPSGLTLSREDLHSSSERNARGQLVSDIIRSNVLKMNVTWKYLTADELQALMELVSRRMFMNVKYYSDLTQAYTTAKMYKGAVSYTPHRVLNTGEIDGWLNVRISLIEK